ncbi:hypothetical protein B0H16DRAFT_1701898 [Mycena metata]|uniref:Uncharacterized protein n=1 Tax=Mycena metata TaxID=1033252 RepID=A0AAD7H8D4_9AGAR|nr:hypothetical protein B0H16DRAFT_1701898 [Mycena metata]
MPVKPKGLSVPEYFWISAGRHPKVWPDVADDSTCRPYAKHATLVVPDSGPGKKKKTVGSAADNASSNGPLNRTICKKCAKINPDTATARNIQIGCGGHVTHLIAQAILHALGMAPPPDVEDMYEQSPVAEMELMANEAKAEKEKKSAESGEDSDVEEVSGDDDASSSESDPDDDEEDWQDEDEDAPDSPSVPKKRPAKKKKARKFFTPVDKVHAVAVHILRSEVRRMKARRLIRRKVDKKSRHLVFIRSMKAFDAFVNELPTGLRGKAAQVALNRKKKWEMSSTDWEFIDKLVKALEVLKLATLEFSQKSVPTIAKVLPLYKLIEVKLTELAEAFLHPAVCLAYFQSPQ